MMRSSLGQLRLGLEGSLSMSEPMERLAAALLANCVPDSWRAWSFPSRRSLAGWNADLRRRIDAIVPWSLELLPPPTGIQVASGPQLRKRSKVEMRTWPRSSPKSVMTPWATP